MQEIGEITEYTNGGREKVRSTEEGKDEVEAGLKIVEEEMGHILEELKENLEILSLLDTETIEKSETTLNEPKSDKANITNTANSLSKNYNVQAIKTIKTFAIPNIQVQKTNYSTKLKKEKSSSKSSNFQWGAGCSNKSFREHTSPIPVIHIPCINTSASPLRYTIPQPLFSKSTIVKKPNLRISHSTDSYSHIKELVETAIRNKKTFTVCGNYYSIRRALLSRGWIEKIKITYNTNDRQNLKKLLCTNIPELIPGVHDPQLGYVYARVIMSKLMRQHQVDFYWDQSFDCFRTCKDSVKLTIMNRFKTGVFGYTSKQGLCEAMKQSHWYQKPGTSWIRHPRSYDLANNDDPKDFINDFKLTAAMSLLKWIVKTQANCNINHLMSDSGKIPIRVYHFAVAELTKAIRKCKHEDIDYEIQEAMDHEWNEFLEYFYKIIHNEELFKSEAKESANRLVNGAKAVLKNIGKYWPHLQMDGMMNVWILKPIHGSRGVGIYLCRTLQYILKIIKSNTTRRYIVQKYIEKPLLIYHTKFDIRQWFIISSASPLIIWMYKEAYVRFSSQLYNLNKLHESVHLTNNSVQTRYKNCVRNVALPNNNMWDSTQFQKYLASIGHPNAYRDIIYPGMKECITGAILLNQTKLNTRRNCFELYGSDFMLTEDFKPWLIEINSRPALYPSTSITARMCPEVLEDVIKVIIDRERDPTANTGRFELIHKGVCEKLPKIGPENLRLNGRQLSPTYFFTPEFTGKEGSLSSEDYLNFNIKQISIDMKKTLDTLLKLIRTERERRKQSGKLPNIEDITFNTNLCIEKENKSEERMKGDENSISDKNKTTLMMIKSDTTNLRATESDVCKKIIATCQHQSLENIVSKPLVNNSDRDNPKSIFSEIMESIRNISLISKSKS